MKMWAGRTDGKVDETVNALNASIGFDKKILGEDIRGSIAHANMLHKIGVLTDAEHDVMIKGLAAIRDDVASGRMEVDPDAEDVHTFVEAELTSRVGQPGKKLHTARSRNDQVALDMRLYTLRAADSVSGGLHEFANALCEVAAKNTHTVMPGYTHMQRAQPVTLALHLMAYAQMMIRDISRLTDSKKRTAISPLGAGALAGTTYPLDREMVSTELGFNGVSENSMDAVSDRDFVVEMLADLSLVMVHLSRFCEEMVYWSSWEFRYVTFSDSFTTGSSIMPQKKNPDVGELVRGKTGRVFGDLMTMLTTLKGLPMAYNKDMQEDKEALFDAVETVEVCLAVLPEMIRTATFNVENMKAAASAGFINATDCADYLVRHGMPFRDAYKVTGQLVNRCTELKCTMETLPLEEYKKLSGLFENDVYEAIDLLTCVNGRGVYGGPAPEQVKIQIANAENWLTNN